MSNRNRKANANKSQNAKSIEVVRDSENTVSFKGTVSATYEGPLPTPEILEGFKAVHPRSVELIFTEFEKNSIHIREMEKRKLEAETEIAKRGQWMAFIMGILLFLLAGLAVYINTPWIAGGALCLGLVGIAKSVSNKK